MCIGIIDGTHVSVKCAKHNVEAYINRKGYCSINNLVIVDIEGYFVFVQAGMYVSQLLFIT